MWLVLPCQIDDHWQQRRHRRKEHRSHAQKHQRPIALKSSKFEQAAQVELIFKCLKEFCNVSLSLSLSLSPCGQCTE